ncbi:type II toxin-antitoxin system PemK/MazF family toxin [Pricia sp. S334]|uniref:Type II toxin-antitoxin system PemK/MazF family toxin n=1 Tax=Pricia mediterranea TaxID=3076079 RepID=A0ABU3L2Y5_9FLAO|nr:type II toxin-antitoxin system PemK/MazF family toxin [Pricia sp. S334]MDT7828110.1 type II toxin-antitoxin system PemK/MazF family toxin [Pricia sp. S334]
MKKTRPCLVISPNEANNNLNTILNAPITSAIRKFPMRMDIVLKNKRGQIALDQMRCIDKSRLFEKIDLLNGDQIKKLRLLLREFLIDD